MEYMARCNEAQRRQVIIPPRATPIQMPETDQKEEVDTGATATGAPNTRCFMWCPRLLGSRLCAAWRSHTAGHTRAFVRRRAGKLKPISLASRLRDSRDNSFFGTSFSNFGRQQKRREEKKAQAKARAAASKAKAAAEAKIQAVLDKEFKAVTCTPSTNVQKNQVRRLLAMTDPIYDSVSTMHEEGQFLFKPLRRNHGIPVVLPSITQRSEVVRREVLSQANDRRTVGGTALARPNVVMNR